MSINSINPSYISSRMEISKIQSFPLLKLVKTFYVSKSVDFLYTFFLSYML